MYTCQCGMRPQYSLDSAEENRATAGTRGLASFLISQTRISPESSRAAGGLYTNVITYPSPSFQLLPGLIECSKPDAVNFHPFLVSGRRWSA